MASTSPLWIVVTAPTAAAGVAQPLVVALCNACILVGAAYMWGLLYLHLIHSRKTRDLVGAAGVAFFTLMSPSVGLMETPLAMLLEGSGFLSVIRGGRCGLPLLCAAVFVRPECLLFALAAVVWKIVYRSSWDAREVALSIVGIGACAAFQLHFYHAL